ncbi:MAG: PAS domain S-box protein [Sterolibacterium sp.]
MKLNKKIILLTIGVLLVSLLISSVVNVLNFRKNYTEALITGSHGLGQSLNSVLSEMLNLGLPLESLSGMDKKLRQMVENNAYISYAGVADLSGKVLFHSNPDLVGKVFADPAMQRSAATIEPLTQLYRRFDGHEYYDVTIPVFDAGKAHVGAIRLGFRTEAVNDKVNLAIGEVVLNFALTFVVIAFLVNYLMARLVSQPVIALSQQARRISAGNFDSEVLVARRDEIGDLSDALNQMSRTIRTQFEALQRSHDELERQVQERTRELALANDLLQEKNLEMTALFENMNSGVTICRLSADGLESSFTSMNRAGERITGMNREDLIGKSMLELFPAIRQSKLSEILHRVWESGVPEAVPQLYYQDERLAFWCEGYVYKLPSDKMVVIFTDVTERKLAEIEREQYFKFFNASPDLMGIADPNGAFKKVNPAFMEMLGYSEAEILARPFIDFVHPDDRQSTLDEMARQLQRGFSLDFENRYVCKDGSIRWLLWCANVNPDEGFTYASARDITDRKQVEEALRAKTQALLRSNADLDQFAYSVSHDMRQPLRMVTGHLQLLEKGLRDRLDEDDRENLVFALDGARRMDAMIVSLLEYSRVGRKTDGYGWIDSRDTLDEALDFLAPAIDEAQAGIAVGGSWPHIRANRDELTRLFQNLVGNAVHYHAVDQPPRIEVDSAVVVRGGEQRWRVSVRDHGIGIDPRQIGRLFQFFSRLQSQERYVGTGMGLALCRRIVEHHGGSIWAESEGEGHGSVFVFEMPLNKGNDEEPGR